MIQRYPILLLLLFSTLSANALQWRDLWFTPDQQAQNLMSENQFEKAQQTFTREDWAATAAYRAGKYKKAEKLYHDLKSEQGYYNRGNALAHVGRYEEAIKSYNKALSLNSANQDALINRTLIEELLKKDKEKKQNQEQEDKEQQGKDKQDKEQQDKDKQDKEQQDKDKQDKEQQDKDKQDKDKQDKEQQNKDKQDKEQQDKDKQDKEQQNKDKQDKEQQDKEQQDKEKKSNQETNIPESETAKEKQHEKEQWLRLIPDDPAGLMREKFLRDHVRRQHGWY